MRLLLIISTLGTGGAERTMTLLAGALARRGHEVTLFAYADRPSPPSFPVDEKVRLVRNRLAPAKAGRGGVGRLMDKARIHLGLLKRIRRTLTETRPDAVISFIDMTNIRVILAAMRTGIRVLVSERCDPSQRSIGVVPSLLRRLLYPLADCLVVQSQDILNFFPARVQRSACVIPNPVDPPPVEVVGPPAYSAAARPRIIALGSLRKVKGFDLLLQAFSSISARHAEWSLVIFGEGDCRRDLERQIAEAGLTGRVHLPGHSRDVYAELRASDIFALSSLTEGFPTALMEAMSMGLACVSFDCPSGPRQMINHGVNGMLVEPRNSQALADVLYKLMNEPGERARLGREALSIRTKYSLDKIVMSWESRVREVTGKVADPALLSGASRSVVPPRT